MGVTRDEKKADFFYRKVPFFTNFTFHLHRKSEGSDEILASASSNNWWAADLCSLAYYMYLGICVSAIHFDYY